jgi:hypothetical protein
MFYPQLAMLDILTAVINTAQEGPTDTAGNAVHPGRLGGVELVTAWAWHGRILAVSRDAPALSAWQVS